MKIATPHMIRDLAFNSTLRMAKNQERHKISNDPSEMSLTQSTAKKQTNRLLDSLGEYWINADILHLVHPNERRKAWSEKNADVSLPSPEADTNLQVLGHDMDGTL